MTITYVTSMPKGIYLWYGKKMLKSWHANWPKGEMLVYCEETLPVIDLDRITVKKFDPHEYELFQYITSTFACMRGMTDSGYDYRLDARKFSKKIFAQCSAAKLTDGILCWLDADIITSKPIPESHLTNMLIDESFVACMRRRSCHLCSSFVLWNCTHAASDSWWDFYLSGLMTGQLFRLQEWHDAFYLEWVLKETRVPVRNVSEASDECGTYNVFDETFLGYAKHYKGNLKSKLKIGRRNSSKGQA